MFWGYLSVSSRYKVYTHNDVSNDEPDVLYYVKNNIIIAISDNYM